MSGYGFATTATVDDELGVWAPLPTVIARDFALESIDAGPAAPAEDVSLWQVSLPRDRSAAGEVLSAASERVALAEDALPYASQRLAAFRVAAGPSPAIAIERAGPELALAGWAAASQSGQVLPDEQGRLAHVAAFFDKVRDNMRSYAAIDTDLGGRRAALTLVSWTGDFRTAWASGLALDDAQRHTAAVALALRTRDAWLRLALTVLSGAVQVAALFGANPALALPAAYRFVRQVIDQVQALRGLPALA